MAGQQTFSGQSYSNGVLSGIPLPNNFGVDNFGSLARVASEITRPSGFVFPFDDVLPWQLYFDSAGDIQLAGFDPADLIPTAVIGAGASIAEFFVSPTGDDATGTGTYAAPWRGIDKALSTATYPCIISILAGSALSTYFLNNSWNTQTPGGSCWVRKIGPGRVVSSISWDPAITITLIGGTMYRASLTNCTAVLDLSNLSRWNKPPRLTYVATQAECLATPGTWSNDGGNTFVFVNRSDGAAVTTNNTMVLRSGVSNGKNPTSGDILVSGIEFWGGSAGAFRSSLNSTGRTAAINCSFGYAGSSSSPSDGFQSLQCLSTILYGCELFENSKDGFNLTFSTVAPVGVAIKCRMYANGWLGSLSNNGITAHGGCKFVMVGGELWGNYGGNLALTDAGTQAWAVGVRNFYSLGDEVLGGTFPSTAWQTLNQSELWLTNCIDYGNARAFSLSGGSRILHKNHISTAQGLATISGGSQLGEYY